MIWDWGSTSSGPPVHGWFLQWSRSVLKSPWLCRLGDASYVMCTALYMMVLYDWARVGPTTKTLDEISIICLFRLILQANTLFCFELWYSSYFEFICSFHIFFKWLLNLWKCDHLLWNSFVYSCLNVKAICCKFDPLIQLEYMSVKMLTDATLFRMAPPTRQNPEPPPPPPPPEAWQAVMATTNANTQLIMQLL